MYLDIRIDKIKSKQRRISEGYRKKKNRHTKTVYDDKKKRFEKVDNGSS